GDHERYARALLELAIGHEQFSRLKPLDWSAVGGAVYPRQWRQLVVLYAPWPSRDTAYAPPRGRDAVIRARSDLVRDGEMHVTIDQRIARAALLFAVAVAVVLLDEGWQINTRPGLPIALVRGKNALDPFTTLRALADGTAAADAWQAQCLSLG